MQSRRKARRGSIGAGERDAVFRRGGTVEDAAALLLHRPSGSSHEVCGVVEPSGACEKPGR